MKKPGYTQYLGVSNQFFLGYNCHMEIDNFMKDPWKHFNEMRNTPHECDYHYIVDSISGKSSFFEICKLCLDTRGVIEI